MNKYVDEANKYYADALLAMQNHESVASVRNLLIKVTETLNNKASDMQIQKIKENNYWVIATDAKEGATGFERTRRANGPVQRSARARL